MSAGFGKPRAPQYQFNEINKLKTDVRQLYSYQRPQWTPNQSVAPLITGKAPPSAPDGYQRLKTAGDTMIGPLAFNEISNVFVTAGNVIDISNNGAYTSYIRLQAGVGVTIKTITGGSFTGQILFLQSGGSGPYTIVNSGNIAPINAGTSFTWQDNDFIILIYDYLSSRWTQVTAPIGSSGANTSLSNLTNPTSINQALVPDAADTRNLGSISKWWFNLYIDDVHFTDTTDPNGKFTDISYNGTTHYLEYSQTISGITAGQIFLYNSTSIFAPCEGDNTFNDVAYMGWYQNHLYTSATAGAASALPATPAGYHIIRVNGVRKKVPYYNV